MGQRGKDEGGWLKGTNDFSPTIFSGGLLYVSMATKLSRRGSGFCKVSFVRVSSRGGGGGGAAP